MLRDLSCPKCGANLDVEEDQRIVKCQFCGASSVLEIFEGSEPKLVASPERRPPTEIGDSLISLQGLQVFYKSGGGLFSSVKQVRAVDNVTFDIKRGETLGLVGE